MPGNRVSDEVVTGLSHRGSVSPVLFRGEGVRTCHARGDVQNPDKRLPRQTEVGLTRMS